MINWTLSELKELHSLREWKCKPRTRRKYLQFKYLVKNLYLRFRKNTYNSTKRKKNIKKWAEKNYEQKLHQRIYSDDKHNKINSTTSVIKEMKVKLTKKGHYLPIRITIKKKINE